MVTNNVVIVTIVHYWSLPHFGKNNVETLTMYGEIIQNFDHQSSFRVLSARDNLNLHPKLPAWRGIRGDKLTKIQITPLTVHNADLGNEEWEGHWDQHDGKKKKSPHLLMSQGLDS